MKNENMKVNRTVTVVSVVVFFAAFAASVALFWKYVIDVFLNQTMFGTAMDVSAVYLISSFLFLAVLIALNVVGFILKNKYLLIISAVYQLLLVVALVLLVFLVNGQIDNAGLYNVLMWVLMVLVAPIFGTVWELGSWFFLVFGALVVLTVVFAIIFHKRKSN